MAVSVVNGVRLFWEETGDSGSPLVLVHGSWGDHHNWDAVVPGLARSFRVFTYDRRGHSQSERLSTQGSIEEDVADLAAFIVTNKLTPAHVVGSSFGAAIAVKLAAAQPDLFATLSIHEPPLIGMIGEDPIFPVVRQRIGAVLATLQSGETELAARQFVENVALGPGMWEKLPPDVRDTFIFNAPTWMDEMNEPESVLTVDLNRMRSFTRPTLLSEGDQSPSFFAAILTKLASAVPQAQHHVYRGGGHVPHLTHPDEFVRVVSSFIGGHD
ncbi:MAG TPA: alpha/beta hydrolase [Vicinamibacterales bacterium]|jgi:pimeloyl-ACP methyl ester carboxylesterase|nr:alpha/beta hydrolase [Vicinamibacterales bacterium]